MITIKKNINGDTRTAPKNVTYKEFQMANNMHRFDVTRVMFRLGTMIREAGDNHDYTKKTEEKMFYRDFLSTIHHGTDFSESEWYQLHIHEERHHLLSHCPEDVNLIDVMEMIADCVCAGMARSGTVRGLEITPDILNKAVSNTVELIQSMIIVEDTQEAPKSGLKDCAEAEDVV